MRYVYALRHAGEIVYVGETNNPIERFRHHRTRSISKFKGLELEIEVLEEIDGDRKESFQCQKKWQEILGLPVDNELNQILRSRYGGRGVKKSLR